MIRLLLFAYLFGSILCSDFYNSTIFDNDDELFDEFYKTNQIATRYVWKTVPFAFLIFGTISNILSILVFLRREMRKFSSVVYFGILNIVNLVLLYATLARIILEFNFEIDIRVLNIFICKLHVFSTYFLGHLSSLILCAISIDRVVSVAFLNKSKNYCTPKVAIIITISLTIYNFILSSHFLFLESAYKMKASNDSDAQIVICNPRDGTYYSNFINNVWTIIDMSFFALIPFVIMTVCSFIIIFRVAKQSQRMQSHLKRSINEKKINNAALRRRSTISSIHEKKSSMRTRNLALMLIPVNILFLIFLAPVVMTMHFYSKLQNDKLTAAIVELLATCNYTFNLVIYFLTSSKFREELYKLFNELNFTIKKKRKRNQKDLEVSRMTTIL